MGGKYFFIGLRRFSWIGWGVRGQKGLERRAKCGKENERGRDRDRDSQTDRQTDRETEIDRYYR